MKRKQPLLLLFFFFALQATKSEAILRKLLSTLSGSFTFVPRLKTTFNDIVLNSTITLIPKKKLSAERFSPLCKLPYTNSSDEVSSTPKLSVSDVRIFAVPQNTCFRNYKGQELNSLVF